MYLTKTKRVRDAIGALLIGVVIGGLIAFAWALTSVALGNDAAGAIAGGEVSPEFLQYLLVVMPEIQQAGVLGGSALIVQLIIKALDQPFAKRFFSGTTGLTKLLIVSGLTLAVTPIGLLSSGVTLGAALWHSTTLAALMVFLNQLYQHVYPDAKLNSRKSTSGNNILSS